MELAYRARDLEQILRPPSLSQKQTRKDLLGIVKNEVEVEIKSLRARIIESLRGRGLKLPSAVKSVSLIRRMSTFNLASSPNAFAAPPSSTAESTPASLTEPELRMTFLVSRWDCLRLQLEQMEISAGSVGSSSNDRVRYVKRWIEVWRETIGETTTIYSEIFLNPSSSQLFPPSSSSSAPAVAPSDPPASEQSYSQLTQENIPVLQLVHPQSVLITFLSKSVASLHSMLLNQLPHIIPISSLASLQTQLAYCSTAFSKFGFDFRHLANDLITDRVQDVITAHFQIATDIFAKDLSRAQPLKTTKGGKSRITIKALIASDSKQSILHLDEAISALHDNLNTTSPQPPSFVALFPPLTKLLNAHASALNELRLLPLLKLYPALRKAQLEQLVLCAQELNQFLLRTDPASAYTVQAAPSLSEVNTEGIEEDDNQSMLQRFTIVFAKCVVPWCIWALTEGVYPDLSKEPNEAQLTDMQHNKLKSIIDQSLDLVGIQHKEDDEVHLDGEGKGRALSNGKGHLEMDLTVPNDTGIQYGAIEPDEPAAAEASEFTPS